MKVAFLASEIVPFAKTGGLADVAGSLPKFLKELGADIKVIMPFYREVRKKNLPLRKVLEDRLSGPQGSANVYSVLEDTQGDFPVYFIENDAFYDRDHLYGTGQGDYPDNGERFAFFSRASLEFLKQTGFSPDIIHGHDWQSALTLAYLRFVYGEDLFFKSTRSLFTIHNLAYQGLFEKDVLAKIGLPEDLFTMDALEFFGKANFMKAGILYASAVNTVSRRYAEEIQMPEFGCGLDGLLRTRRDSLFGILNGVDYSSWNPASDEFIPGRFSPEDLSGKRKCKAELMRAFGLPAAKAKPPVVGMVSRLAGQKGFDLLCDSLESIFNLGVRLVILGTGEEKFQNILKDAQRKFPESLGLKIAFDETLSHLIYAGSDIFLIPSRYEPCGLTQMYSLKYGTIPVVRATGGLDDTIQEFDPARKNGNGFKFADYSTESLLAALKKAAEFYHRKDDWNILVQNAMAADFSWERSAREYLALYSKIKM